MTDWIPGAVCGAALSPLLIKACGWLLGRNFKRDDEDRARQATEISGLWKEVNCLKKEQANLREKIAPLPTKDDFMRLEERLEKRLDLLTEKLLNAMRP